MAFIFSVPVYVPIIVLDRSHPVDTIKKLLHLYRTQGLGFVGLIALIGAGVIGIVGVIFAPVFYISTRITTKVASVSMGDDFSGMVASTPEAFSHGWFGFLNPFALDASALSDTAHEIGGAMSGLVGLMAVSVVIATLMVMLFSAGVVVLGRIRREPKAARASQPSLR